ncbi:MAG: phage GP46 family protein [Pseudomonadota bacterium]
MVDIRTVFDPSDFVADYLLLPSGQLDNSRDIATAIVISLFTDRRADDTDVLPLGETDRRGVWSDVNGLDLYGVARQGSRLWLLAREKVVEDVRVRAEFYITEALQWMIDLGVVARFAIDVAFAGPVETRRLEACITAFRADGTRVDLRFERLWQDILETA